MQVRKDCDFQHLSRQTNAKSVKCCENCVFLENQLSHVQEVLKTAKLLIHFLSKNMELKEVNLENRVNGAISEQLDKKFSTWSDVVKDVRKLDIDMQQSRPKHIQVIINQGVIQESDEK
jgi:hypothetical protein